MKEFVSSKVEEWSANISTLSDIAKSQPHAAYSALTHGLSSKWTHLSRVQPSISDLLIPLDNTLRTQLIPALTCRPPPSDQECILYDLPARHGGLGIRLPSHHADREHQNSKFITQPLSNHILEQNSEYDYDTLSQQKQKRAELSRVNRQRIQSDADNILQQLPEQLQRAVDLARQKGSSSWLTTLPLTEHGFALHKAAFHDALALRYGWVPNNMPSTCDCGKHFSVEHALSCARGGFPTIRHNEVRDITATLLTEVCHNVCVEPDLQPVTSNQLDGATANRQDGARLDISANGVWGGRFEKTYFDVRVINPHAPSNRNQGLSGMYKAHERAKKRAYEQRVREVEHSSFTPLVLSANGGMGNESLTFYRRLASLLAEKWDSHYSTTLGWLRCRLSYSLLRSAIQAIRGARSTRGHAGLSHIAPINLIASEARLHTDH